MFNLDIQPDGNLLITDDSGYRLVLRPVGGTGELLAKILLARKMGRTKIGQEGAPFQSQVFDMEKEMERLRKQKAAALLSGLNIDVGELDL